MEVKRKKKRKNHLGSPSIPTNEFASLLAKKIGCNKNDGIIITNAFVESIVELCAQGYSVTFNNFGAFTIKEKKERVGLNTLGEKCVVPPFKALSFKQSILLKRLLNREDDDVE